MRCASSRGVRLSVPAAVERPARYRWLGRAMTYAVGSSTPPQRPTSRSHIVRLGVPPEAWRGPIVGIRPRGGPPAGRGRAASGQPRLSRRSTARGSRRPRRRRPAGPAAATVVRQSAPRSRRRCALRRIRPTGERLRLVVRTPVRRRADARSSSPAWFHTPIARDCLDARPTRLNVHPQCREVMTLLRAPAVAPAGRP